MAILNKIRQKTVVLILVIALALFAFILSSLFDNKDALFNKSPNVVATINGKDISREAFMAKVEAQNNPNASQTQIMNQVYNAEVRKLVMQEQFDKLGLTVGREQMRDILRTNLANSPEFLNADGVFDEGVLNSYIANLKETSKPAYQQWVDYENNASSNALQQNYINMVKAATSATLAEGKLNFKLESDKIDIKYVYVPFTSIADSTVAVSKSEISSYINTNSNKYKVESSRNLQYVKFEEVASLEDEKTLQTDLSNLIKNKVEYNNGVNDTVIGFAKINIDKVEGYINANSDADIKYQDRAVYKKALPKLLQDNVGTLEIGKVYGPYKDGKAFKVSKLLAIEKSYDSLKVRHILIPFKDSLNTNSTAVKTIVQAKKTADSILSIVRRDKSKFEGLVSLSSDQGSVAKGGVYDWHASGTMVKEFNDFEITKRVGDIGVVKTQFGFHVIELLGRKPKKEAYKIATIVRNIEPSVATEDLIFRNASNFEVALESKDFLDVAKENNLKVNPVTSVKELDETIPGAGAQRPVVRWAFEDGTKVGETKRFETTDGYIVVQVTGKNEAGLMNVEDASVTALPEIRKNIKAKTIRDRVTANTLEDFAAAESQQIKTALAINMKNPTISGVGLEPMVVGHAFGLAEGATSKLITGSKGVFMVQLTKMTPAVELDNYQSFANQVGIQKLNTINSRLYDALKETANIEDNRAKTVQ